MTQTSDSPFEVRSGSEVQGNLAIAKRVLNAVAAALSRFLDDGQPTTIDLRNVPWMHESTYRYLREALAAGEVTAVVGPHLKVEVTETQYPGVWWLTHRNERGGIATELIEVTEVPEILKPHVVDLRAGLKRLEQSLAAAAPPDQPPGISTALQ
jgi:hydrogenase-1 operon protein HyaF